MTRRCDQCEWWQCINGRRGICRHDSPRIVEGIENTDGGRLSGWWPETDPEEWCGKFTIKGHKPGSIPLSFPAQTADPPYPPPPPPPKPTPPKIVVMREDQTHE